jgi:hypothetical protein
MPFEPFISLIRILLPSMPFNNFVETEDYDLEEALKSIVPDTAPVVSQSTSSQGSQVYTSYPSFCLLRLCRHHTTIPLQFLTQPSPTVWNCTFEHPQWTQSKWNTIWKSKPFVLDPINIPVPVIESTFHGALLRIQLTEEHLPPTAPLLIQGTTIVFEGDEFSDNRYVVEWCEKIENQNAYLKVVGMDKNRYPHPYNDPRYPTFILVVPSCRSAVAHQPGPAAHPSYSHSSSVS